MSKAIRQALRRIEEAHPDLGVHLAKHIRTGVRCIYTGDGLEWRTD